MFERSADAILILEDGRFVDCNRATVEMLRYQDKAALLSTHPSELSPPKQPDGQPSFEKANAMMALAFERGSHRFEWEHVRATGEVFPVEVLLTAIKHGAQPVLHVVWRDITERKQLEESLRVAQRMEALGRLSGGIAHDFNNLLVAILGHADILTETLQGDARLASVREIRGAGERAAALVRQLLAFARKQDHQPRVVDLASAVRDLDKMLRRLLGEHLQIGINAPQAPVTIRAATGQVEQVVINLTTNARDAMRGGGRIDVAVRSVDVVAGATGLGSALAPGPYAFLSVSDTGAGMDPTTAARAFDPFFTTKAPGEGTGLGLATVYAIARQNGGVVDIQTAPGLGTTVTVIFPRTEDAVPRQPEPDTGAASGPVSGTILLAEDEDLVAGFIVRVLSERGYRVLRGADGIAAIDLWRAHSDEIRLVLTDVVMPRLGGVDMVRQLRAEGYEGPALFASAFASHAMDNAADILPEVDMLEKPFGTSELLTRVRAAMGRQRG